MKETPPSKKEQVQNFSFHKDSYVGLNANRPRRNDNQVWNAPVQRPLDMDMINTFSIAEMVNPYTRTRWMDQANHISKTLITPAAVDKMDFEAYNNIFCLLRQTVKVQGQKIRGADSHISEVSTTRQDLHKKLKMLEQAENDYLKSEKEFKQQLAKLEEKRKHLKTRYDNDK